MVKNQLIHQLIDGLPLICRLRIMVGGSECLLPRQAVGGTCTQRRYTSSTSPRGIALTRNSSVPSAAWSIGAIRVSHEDHTHDTLLGRATPQGCPLAPLTLAMWVTAGVRFVRVSFDHPLQHFAYMDDLNFDFQSLDGN